jgi:3-deoxy-D-manno-octulosonic-acid transferase
MPRALYSLLVRLLLPCILLRLWWQGLGKRELLRDWQHRLGLVPRSPQPVIWVHAVSVGETIAAAPLVEALLARHPEQPILLTAMTATGRERARALFGQRVRYAYSPWDSPGSVRRFLDRVRPRALVIMETELWPNMIAQSRARGVPVALVNARLSERSARGYRKVAALVRPLLQDLAWIAAQAPEDAHRFLALGAPEDRVAVTGTVKYDIAVQPALREAAAALRAQLGEQRPVWVAGSTHPGESELLLAAQQRLLASHPDALLILVPRHPERFDQVAALVEGAGLRLARRSRGEDAQTAGVYLGDSMGELMQLYGASDAAFIGGSLIDRGGHNPLEPAAWGLPVISGPHVFNFEAVYAALSSGGALSVVTDAESLAQVLLRLLGNPQEAREQGARALAVVEANRGALDRVVAGVSGLLNQGSP